MPTWSSSSPPNRPTNEGWWPAYTAWQAFAVKVLAEGGRNQDSNITRLYGYRERMPVFALAYLHDAMLARRETTGARVTDLRRRLANAILSEAGSSHVEELNDPYLLWFWNSNVRSTAIVLNSLVNGDACHAVGAAAPRRRPRAGALADRRPQGRPLGQHPGERARDGGAGQLLPPVRAGRPGLPGDGEPRRPGAGAGGVPRPQRPKRR